MPNFKKKSRKINVYLNRETSLSIYGFNENQVNQLKQIALEKYGEANISLWGCTRLALNPTPIPQDF